MRRMDGGCRVKVKGKIVSQSRGLGRDQSGESRKLKGRFNELFCSTKKIENLIAKQKKVDNLTAVRFILFRKACKTTTCPDLNIISMVLRAFEI